MKIRFIQSPIVVGLAYPVGAEAEINEIQAKELIETGFAEAIEEVRNADEVKPTEVKKAVKKK
jgi:hypothetical protein